MGVRYQGMKRISSMLFVVLWIICGAAKAQELTWRELRIPTTDAGSAGLEGLLVFPNDGVRHPLAIISHGSPREAKDRTEMTSFEFFPAAMEFARRGWTTA